MVRICIKAFKCTFSQIFPYLTLVGTTDQITALNVVRQRDILLRRGNIYGWCKENFINFSAINMISDLRKNASRELESLGFPSSSVNGFHNRNEDYPHLAFHQAAICAGLYPNIAYRRCVSTIMLVWSKSLIQDSLLRPC